MAKARMRRQQPDTSQPIDQPKAKFTPPPPLRPLTEAQRHFLSSLRSNTLTLSKGSAGTGKTYVALSYAAQLLHAHEIERLILTRPLVGVDGEDEKIGALPGELGEKMQFWAMPMLDVLEARLGPGEVQYMLRHDRIRVVPMAYLRGSSFDDTFIHCTEAQNTTPTQLKMLLTRVGERTKVCVDGDPYQSDLRRANGLEDAITRLEGMSGVGVISFTRDDVVRSGFCQQVLDRYEI